MTSKIALVAAAVSGVVALSASAPRTAHAAPQMEKCYGVAKAGKNDCAGAAHACAGQSTKNGAPQDFVLLPKGTCSRLVGGSLTPAK